jgi:hypothetical protein
MIKDDVKIKDNKYLRMEGVQFFSICFKLKSFSGLHFRPNKGKKEEILHQENVERLLPLPHLVQGY